MKYGKASDQLGKYKSKPLIEPALWYSQKGSTSLTAERYVI